MSTKNAWAGIRLVPLSHESSFSALLRFAWQNVIDARTMKQLLNGKRLSLYGDSFSNPTWLHQCGLKAIANWDLPNLHESEFPVSFEKFGSVFFSKNLKVCPLCFGAGFHSSWHQLSLLHHCPMHGCKLVENCQECGSKFGEYRFSKDFFEFPYRCSTCRAPMVGVAIDLENLLNQRNEIASDTSFDEIAKWYKSAQDELFLLRAVVETSYFTSANGDDGKLPILLRMAHTLHPFPKEFSGPAHVPQLTLLSWNIRARISDETNIMQNRREIVRSNSNRQMSKTIYAVTTRRIQSWLATFLSQSTLERAFEDFLTSKFKKMETLNSAAIAFVLFRNCLELSPKFSPSGTFLPSGFRFDHSPPFRLYSCTEREPRLAYYAMYFAIYAELYWRVEQARACGKLSEIQINGMNSLLFKFLLQSDDRVAGGVIFRTIPGFPLPGTLLRTFKDAKDSLASSKGFQAVEGQFG